MHRILVCLFLLFIEETKETTYECDTSSKCGCSASTTLLTRIVGGESASQGSWAWAVVVEGNGFICGGTIISSSFIVTAAHCTAAMESASKIRIYAGTVDLQSISSNGISQTRSVEQIYQHPNFDGLTITFDISLLRLSTPLNIDNQNVKPICLPTDSIPQPPDDIDMIAVGWGVTQQGSTDTATILQQVTLKSVNENSPSCQAIIRNTNVQFCAGILQGGKDTCQGDSGGPLMAFVNGLWQLDGITSAGPGCAQAGYVAFYTRVTYFIPWIKSIVPSDQIEINSQTTTTTTTTTTTLTRKKPLTVIRTTNPTTTSALTRKRPVLFTGTNRPLETPNNNQPVTVSRTMKKPVTITINPIRAITSSRTNLRIPVTITRTINKRAMTQNRLFRTLITSK